VRSWPDVISKEAIQLHHAALPAPSCTLPRTTHKRQHAHPMQSLPESQMQHATAQRTLTIHRQNGVFAAAAAALLGCRQQALRPANVNVRIAKRDSEHRQVPPDRGEEGSALHLTRCCWHHTHNNAHCGTHPLRSTLVSRRLSVNLLVLFVTFWEVLRSFWLSLRRLEV